MSTTSVSKYLVALTALVAIGAGAGVTALASAQSATSSTDTQTAHTATDATHGFGRGFGDRGKGHGIMGSVSAVSGNTITLTAKDGTSYTVDASQAKISKMVDLTVSDVKVGDTLGVAGTISGSTVSAVHIMDGVPPTPQAPPTTQSQ